MKRATGTYVKSTTLGEVVQAFVPDSLPPKNPTLELEVYQDLNRKAEMALARRRVGLGPFGGLAALQRDPQGSIAHIADRGHTGHSDRPV